MADHRAKTPESIWDVDLGKLSPKVFVPVLAGILLTAIGTGLAAIQPEAFEALGAYAVPAALAIGVIAQGILGYAKKDPAHEAIKQERRALAEVEAEYSDPDVGV